MRKDIIFETIRSIIKDAGYEGFISVSVKDNELADWMVYSYADHEKFIAIDGTPLFPLSAIKNITYQFKKNDAENEPSFHYVDSHIQIRFELKLGGLYVAEHGDNGFADCFRFESEWITDDVKIADALAAYNDTLKERAVLINLINLQCELMETGQYSEEIPSIRQAILKYLNNRPEDLDFLYDCAYSAILSQILHEDIASNPQPIINRIVRMNCVGGFLTYIQMRHYDNPGFLNLMSTETLKFIQSTSN